MTGSTGGNPDERVALVRQPNYDERGVSAALKRALLALEMNWSAVIQPGDRVVLKPNLIRESHTRRPEEWEQIITHGSVIASVAEAVANALRGRGRITIADGPQTDSDFQTIDARLGLSSLARRISQSHPGIEIEIVDLRRERWRTTAGTVIERTRLPDAPGGYSEVDLGPLSLFHGRNAGYYGADYDTSFTQRHHSGGRNAYLLARLALDADVFVNLPKLKTHKKVGITVSLKNLVGINGDKNYLPHFTMGTPAEGGDEFPPGVTGGSTQSIAIRAFKRAALAAPVVAGIIGPAVKRAGEAMWGRTSAVVRSGNWYGNDTAWRMVLDLNRILLYFDGSCARRTKPLRYLSIVDGIVAGDGDGPMEADAVPAGVILAGTNPAAVDLAASRLMGLDWRRIPMIREAFAEHELPIAAFDPAEVRIVPGLGEPFRFRPHFGWRGAIEA